MKNTLSAFARLKASKDNNSKNDNIAPVYELLSPGQSVLSEYFYRMGDMGYWGHALHQHVRSL